jgi:hypothetical protein
VGERGKRNAEQADFALGVAVLAEEIKEDGEDVSVELPGLRESFRTRVGFKSGVTDRQREGARGQTRFAETLAGFLREMAEHGFHFGDVGGVFAEGVIVGDGFGLGVDQEFVGVAAACFAIKGCSPLAEDFFQLFLRVRGKLVDGFNAEGAEGTFGNFTDAGNFADGQRCEETRFHAGGDPDEASGLALIGGDFCGEAGGGEPAGAGKAGLTRDGAKKFVGGGKRWAVEAFGAGEVEIGFVDGNHFDDGREFREDGSDAIAPFGIFFVVAVEEDGVRTEAACGAQGHSGVDAEFAGFVAGGGDYAALVGAAADDNRFAAEIRAREEFDGDEEGVHVHVEDGGLRRNFRCVGGIMFGSEARQIRHGISVRLWSGGGNQGNVKFWLGAYCSAETLLPLKRRPPQRPPVHDRHREEVRLVMREEIRNQIIRFMKKTQDQPNRCGAQFCRFREPDPLSEAFLCVGEERQTSGTTCA